MGFLSSLLLFGLQYVIFYLQLITHWFLYFFHLGKKKTVPAPKSNYLLQSAVSLAKGIREGKLKSEDVIQSYIHRIQQVEPYINAVVVTCYEDALKEARQVDNLIASGSVSISTLESEKPFLGVPISVKNLFQVKGLKFSSGSLLYENRIAEEDAEAVSLMKKAGAICICTTNCPEFGMCLDTYNKAHGRTKNPHDITRTSGASSGGEAALLAAAGSVLGIGNDLAGSVRFPALYNGIFGHKPSAGITSNKGTFPVTTGILDDYLTTGPMCRYAEDLVAAMKVLAGHKAEHLNIGKPVDMKSLKMYYLLDSPDPFAPKLDKEIELCISKVIDYFEMKYDKKIEKANIKSMKYVFSTWAFDLVHTIDDRMSFMLDNAVSKPIIELLKYIFGFSKFTFMAIVMIIVTKLPFFRNKKIIQKNTHRLKRIQEEFDAILDDNSVLLLPTRESPALYHYEWLVCCPGLGYTAFANTLGYPGTSCPVGKSKTGLPLGLQVLAAKNRDNLTLAVALEIEKAFGGWISPNS